MRSSPTRRRTPTRRWSIGCSTRRITASTGAGTGSTWSASPRPTASSATSAKPNAWRYRDYVIRSLQRRQAVRPVPPRAAGRRRAARRRRPTALIATGYYRLGIWDDEPADPQQARYDELDDIVATTGPGLPRPDGQLRPLPRPQDRPVPAEGLLPALRSSTTSATYGNGARIAGRGVDRPGRASAGADRTPIAAHRKRLAEIDEQARSNRDPQSRPSCPAASAMTSSTSRTGCRSCVSTSVTTVSKEQLEQYL